MKKILFFLLIAFVITTTVQEDKEDLEGWWSDLWGNFTAFLSKLTGEAKKIYKWLKDNGYWDIIVSLVKKFAVPAAITACTTYTGAYAACSIIINVLVSFIK